MLASLDEHDSEVSQKEQKNTIQELESVDPFIETSLHSATSGEKLHGEPLRRVLGQFSAANSSSITHTRPQ